MKPSLLDILSKHQFLLTSVVIGLFLASSALLTTNYFKNQTAYVAASCYLPSEVTAKEAELVSLQSQIISIQNEIYQLEQSISSSAGASVTNSYNIDNLRAEIRSDWDIEQERYKMEAVCSQTTTVANCSSISDSYTCTNSTGCLWGGGTDPNTAVEPMIMGTPDYCFNDPNITATSIIPTCSEASAYYTSIKNDNDYKKTLLAQLEAQNGSNNIGYLTNTLAERKSALETLTNTQIPEVIQTINIYNSNICPTTESICDDSIDNDRDGVADCEDLDCSGTQICQGGGGGGGTDTYGCTDSAASNYNSAANKDDGSCTYPISGCTNSAASNYNPAATIDDGSCSYGGSEICNDGVDNDGDNAIDCGDSDCSGADICRIIDTCSEDADAAQKQCHETCTQDGNGCRDNCQMIPDESAAANCQVPEPNCEYMCNSNTDPDPSCVSSCPTVTNTSCLPLIKDPACIVTCNDGEQSCHQKCDENRANACKGTSCQGAACPQPITSCAICEYDASEPVFAEECRYLEAVNSVEHKYTEWHNVSETEAFGQNMFKNRCQKTARDFRYINLTHSCSLNFDKATQQTKDAIATLTSWNIDWKETVGKEIRIIDSGCHSLGGYYGTYRTAANGSFTLAMLYANKFQGTIIQGGNQTFGFTNLRERAPGYVTYTASPPLSGPINESYITFAACPAVGSACYTNSANPNGGVHGPLEQEPILCGNSYAPERYYCDAKIPSRQTVQEVYEGLWQKSNIIYTP